METKKDTELEEALEEEKYFYKYEDLYYDRLNIEKQRKKIAKHENLGTKLENFKWDLEYKEFKANDLDEVYREVKNKIKIKDS